MVIMANVRILGVEVSHGKKVVGNEFYFEHFKEQNKDVTHFFKDVMGRNVRYEIDRTSESALTLAKQSVNAVLKSCNLTGEDIDMIIYSGTLPEYVTPTSALHIHAEIKGKKECFCHDMNLNCVGMTYALDMANRYIETNPKINKVLIVGSDILTRGVNPENENNYGLFGDASCAIICAETEEDSKIIDSCIGTDTKYINKTRFPACGFSHVFDDLPKEERYAHWEAAPPWWLDGLVNDTKKIVKENKLEINDISMFCFSQLAIKNTMKFRESLDISDDKCIFIADRYGYTGTTSPFIAFYEAVKEERIKRGDYVVFATSALGGTYMSLLIKY